ncbi:hypothetical protein [Staphylospora marina]|uniref:hypothetical protein n=1 Tax=Staphylospora marina TaxID=2490858 RepID=UPI000F5C0A88|nr:hypothetical protein [Staphylospora marina]
MSESLERLVLTGRFREAEQLASRSGREVLEAALKQVGLEDRNLAAYAFLNHLIQKHETADTHFLAAMLLHAAFSHLPGSMASAMHHARRAAELAPDKVRYKEFLLMFRDAPEELMSPEEAEELARQILRADPDSVVARSVLGWF